MVLPQQLLPGGRDEIMKQLWNIAHYELMHVLKDPILFVIVFLAPLFYVGLFGSVYFSSILSNIPLAVVDQDNSTLSRDLRLAFANDHNFRIVPAVDSYDAMEQGMKDGMVRAGIVIPHNFEQNVRQGHSAKILSVYDASNLIWGFNSRKYTQEVITNFASHYTAGKLAGAGYTEREIENVMNSVECNVTAWYNPNYSYSNFLFMGLMMLVVHQIGLFGVCLAVTREKERNSWVQYIASSIPARKITLGKCLPYLIANFFNYALLLWISSRFIYVKIEGSVLLLACLGLLYVGTVTFAGYLVSLYSSNSLQATRYLMLLSVPLIMLSGYTWPRAYIPGILNSLALLFPSSWMVIGFRMVSIKNAGWQLLWPTAVALGIMAVLAIYFALNFQKERKPENKHSLMVNSGLSYPRKINMLGALRQQLRAKKL